MDAVDLPGKPERRSISPGALPTVVATPHPEKIAIPAVSARLP